MNRSRGLEQLRGSSSQPATQEEQVVQSLALLGRCPSRTWAARRHGADRKSIQVAVCPSVTQAPRSDGVVDVVGVLNPFSSGCESVETSVTPIVVVPSDEPTVVRMRTGVFDSVPAVDEFSSVHAPLVLPPPCRGAQRRKYVRKAVAAKTVCPSSRPQCSPMSKSIRQH